MAGPIPNAPETLQVQWLRLRDRAVLPERMTPLSAGYDVYACPDDPQVLLPGARAKIPTGWAIAIPAGYEGQVRPRSGLASRHGVTILNAPGTIDADYRGEVSVLLVNFGTEPFEIESGQRIAQIVFAPVLDCAWKAVDVLPPSPTRGEGGFGSTGA